MSRKATEGEKLTIDSTFQRDLAARQRVGKGWGAFFYISNFVGLFVLVVLILHVLNSAFGLVVLENSVEPDTLADRPLVELSEAELATIITEQLGARARVVIRDKFSTVPPEEFTIVPLGEALGSANMPEAYQQLTINDLAPDDIAALLTDNLGQGDLLDIVEAEVIKPRVIKTWTLLDSVLNRTAIEAEVAERWADNQLEFRSWISFDFINSSVSSSATTAGLRTALLGSLWIILITAVTSLIVGVSAAVYLEEYAVDNWINRIIEINIRNLAAIPSIIYGMLGLAVFAFALANITGGYVFGQNLPAQSADQIVSYIQTAAGEPALDNAARSSVRQAVASARGDGDEEVALMVRSIDTDTLTEGQKEALVRLFLSYRLPSLTSLGTFSTPSFEAAKSDIVHITGGDLLPEEALNTLAENLQSYGTFNVNGRTVVSAGLTLALLILPLIIVNAQEALRAVPYSVREASYGLGATRWQTTSRQVLPAALPGIMTGVILAVSRAIGETAPLLVVGASTFIGIDPNGPFSKFTVVPIQIYQWTARPEQEFRAVAAAAIIVLLVVMLMMNALAIFIRNRYTIKF